MKEMPYLGVHCHFYQPPRGNPFSSAPLTEADAAPYANWNERITAECYEPNARLGNFDLISFNVGEALAAWLENKAQETYQRIIQADATHLAAYNIGNAIALPIHHTILPLDRRPDKVTQVFWGKTVFTRRFGRTPQAMWLPEMAVDYETLSVLLDQGIQWTILTESQVAGKPNGAGPYWVRLGHKRIKVFVRDELLSNDIAFSLGRFGGAGRWARGVLLPRKRGAGPFTLIATDGETFGHHWPGEEQFLHWLLTYEALAAGYEVTTLARYVQMVEPTDEIEVLENTAWSCSHNLGRWATGCACTPGESSWKGAVRRALDNLRSELDSLYQADATQAGADPFALRDAYIHVVLGEIVGEALLGEHGLELKRDRADRLLKLVEAQFYRQRMYASCTFFFPELDSHTMRYGIANAAYAIRLTREATGADLGEDFRHDLAVATQAESPNGRRLDAATIYDQVVAEMLEH